MAGAIMCGGTPGGGPGGAPGGIPGRSGAPASMAICMPCGNVGTMPGTRPGATPCSRPGGMPKGALGDSIEAPLGGSSCTEDSWGDGPIGGPGGRRPTESPSGGGPGGGPGGIRAAGCALVGAAAPNEPHGAMIATPGGWSPSRSSSACDISTDSSTASALGASVVKALSPPV
eukprot:scaffold195673_cov31-Tisochrysis_lutea.AAC.2